MISKVRALKTLKEFEMHKIHSPSEGTPERYAAFVANMMTGDNSGEKYEHWKQEALAEIAYGEELRAQGYHIHFGHRRVRGLPISVPEDAEEWMMWPAGYLGGVEAERLIYVTAGRESDSDSDSD